MRPGAKVLPMVSAILISAAHAAGIGDYAPLTSGNTWVYSISIDAGGFEWNPRVAMRIRRTLRVESGEAKPGGGAIHILSFRDSLYQRWRTPDKGSGASPELPDTVRTGRFQVAESAADGRLALHPLGDPIPPAMEFFFRRRIRSGEVAVPTGNGDSLHLVSVAARYNPIFRDTALYARNLGLLYFNRYYDLLGEGRIPGWNRMTCNLIAFNGKPINPARFPGAGTPGPVVEGFSSLRTGRTWRYRGLRQQVTRTGGAHLRRDSIDRKVAVSGVTDSAGIPIYLFSLRDSLHHRVYDGQPRMDSTETGGLTVTLRPGNPVPPVSARPGIPETLDDICIHFNLQSFLEETLETHDYGNGPVRIAVYREGIPGLLEDTLVHAEGIGLVRRARVLQGIDPGLSERIDWRLVEVDGKPFEAVPVPIRKDPAPRVSGERPPGRSWPELLRLRNLLGRIRKPWTFARFPIGANRAPGPQESPPVGTP